MTNKEAIKILEKMKACMIPLGPLLEGKSKDEEAVDIAIEALEKQIPKPMMEEMDISGRPIRVCGNCGDAPGNGEFCRWCGQRIER